MAKIVYLDTSDYQKLANVAGEKKFDDLGRLLISKVRSGEIEIRFSAFHMYEMTQRAPEQAFHFVPRVEKLSALTRGKCFRNALELYYLQVAALVSGEEISSINPRMEKNCWMQESFQSGPEVPGLREMVFLSKDSVRKMARIQGLPTVGNGLQLLLEAYKKNNPGYEKDKLEDYEDGLRWHTDGLPEYKTSIHPVRWIKHMKRLQAATDGFNPQETIAKLTQVFGAQIGVARESLRTELSQDKNKWEKNVAVQIGEISALPWSPRFNEALSNRMGLNLTAAQWERFTNNPADGTVLGNVRALYNSYIKLHHLERGTPKQIQNGDLMDLMHMTHIPFVDIFRSDGPNSDVAKEFAENHSARVMGSIDDLFDL